MISAGAMERPPDALGDAWDGGRVRVVVRVRPLCARDVLAGDAAALAAHPAAAAVRVAGTDYVYDGVAGPDATQAEVYEAHVAPLVKRVLAGYAGTVIAYGQTGGGKTHTLLGAAGEHEGVGPRALRALYARLEEEGASFAARASFVEVYQEAVADLLAGGRALSVRDDASGGAVLVGVTERPAPDVSAALDVLFRGAAARTTHATAMNAASSRSHAVFCLSFVCGDTAGTLRLVDLAGSERLARTRAGGARAREAAAINGGLLALGNVIGALAASRRHVPYRDSRLTRLLRDALGGRSATLLLACVSPAGADAGESTHTLRYASRARCVRNAVRRAAPEGDDARLLVAGLRRELVVLKAELARVRAQCVCPSGGGGGAGGGVCVGDRGSLRASNTANRCAAGAQTVSHSPVAARRGADGSANNTAVRDNGRTGLPPTAADRLVSADANTVSAANTVGQPHWLGDAQRAVERARALAAPVLGHADAHDEAADACAAVAELAELVEAAARDAREMRARMAEADARHAARLAAATAERDEAVRLVSALRVRPGRGAGSAQAADDGGPAVLRNLRAALAHARAERARMAAQLDAAAARLRDADALRRALAEAQRNKKADAETIARLAKTVDAQRILLARRAEAAVAAGMRSRLASAPGTPGRPDDGFVDVGEAGRPSTAAFPPARRRPPLLSVLSVSTPDRKPSAAPSPGRMPASRGSSPAAALGARRRPPESPGSPAARRARGPPRRRSVFARLADAASLSLAVSAGQAAPCRDPSAE